MRELGNARCIAYFLRTSDFSSIWLTKRSIEDAIKTRMPRAHDRVFTLRGRKKSQARSEEDLIVISSILVTVLAGNLIGDGLRSALDPRLRE